MPFSDARAETAVAERNLAGVLDALDAEYPCESSSQPVERLRRVLAADPGRYPKRGTRRCIYRCHGLAGGAVEAHAFGALSELSERSPIDGAHARLVNAFGGDGARQGLRGGYLHGYGDAILGGFRRR